MRIKIASLLVLWSTAAIASITSTIEPSIVIKLETLTLAPTATQNAIISSEIYLRQWGMTSSVSARPQLENTEIAPPMVLKSNPFPTPTSVVTRWLPSRPSTILPAPTSPVTTDPDPKNDSMDKHFHIIIAIVILGSILIIGIIGVSITLVSQCYRRIRSKGKHDEPDTEMVGGLTWPEEHRSSEETWAHVYDSTIRDPVQVNHHARDSRPMHCPEQATHWPPEEMTTQTSRSQQI